MLYGVLLRWVHSTRTIHSRFRNTHNLSSPPHQLVHWILGLPNILGREPGCTALIRFTPGLSKFIPHFSPLQSCHAPSQSYPFGPRFHNRVSSPHYIKEGKELLRAFFVTYKYLRFYISNLQPAQYISLLCSRPLSERIACVVYKGSCSPRL